MPVETWKPHATWKCGNLHFPWWMGTGAVREVLPLLFYRPVVLRYSLTVAHKVPVGLSSHHSADQLDNTPFSPVLLSTASHSHFLGLPFHQVQPTILDSAWKRQFGVKSWGGILAQKPTLSTIKSWTLGLHRRAKWHICRQNTEKEQGRESKIITMAGQIPSVKGFIFTRYSKSYLPASVRQSISFSSIIWKQVPVRPHIFLETNDLKLRILVRWSAALLPDKWPFT